SGRRGAFLHSIRRSKRHWGNSQVSARKAATLRGANSQECCPFNRPPSTSRNPTLFPTEEPAYQPRDVAVNSKVTDLLYLTEEEFRKKLKGSPIKRTKRRGLLRNAAAALCTQDDKEAIAALEHALTDPEPLVRTEAASHSTQ